MVILLIKQAREQDSDFSTVMSLDAESNSGSALMDAIKKKRKDVHLQLTRIMLKVKAFECRRGKRRVCHLGYFLFSSRRFNSLLSH